MALVGITRAGYEVVRQIIPTSSGTHDPCAIGHHGLFSYRLDLDSVTTAEMEGFTSPPAITTLSEGVYYNVNRFYSSRHQRFLQQDMNATGMGVIEQAACLAGNVYSGIATFDVQSLYGGGFGLFCYASNEPCGNADALGLYGTPFDTGIMGFSIAQFAFDLTSEAAFNQQMDLDWATNWSAGDSDHTRLDAGWIEQLQLQFVADEVTPLNAVFAGKLEGAIDMMRGMRGAMKFAASELHHVIPKFLGGLSDGILAKMPRELHRLAPKEHLHAVINNVCKGPPMNKSPYGRGGGKAIRDWLADANRMEVVEFRRKFYDALVEFDGKWGTTLGPAFCRELLEQRKVVGKVGFFQ